MTQAKLVHAIRGSKHILPAAVLGEEPMIQAAYMAEILAEAGLDSIQNIRKAAAKAYNLSREGTCDLLAMPIRV